MLRSRDISQLILEAGRLPGYKKHPFDTYSDLKKWFGIKNIDHPRHLYRCNPKLLRMAAEKVIGRHKRKFAATGFATGLPGGPVVITAGTVVDLEEYVRRLFLMAQEIGHVYGLIPNPFIEEIDPSDSDYFESVKEEILKAILIGLGVGGVSLGISKGVKLLAQKEAREIVRKNVNQKVITRLAKRIGSILGRKVTKSRIASTAGKVIPVIGGGVNAAINYFSIDKVGKNIIKNFEKEYKRVRPLVFEYWAEKEL